MKKSIILGFVTAFALCVSARAETDTRSLAVIRDIQKGTDNANQIQTLRVRDSVVLPSGSISAGSLASGSVAASDIGTIAQVYTGTATIVSTSYTPAFIGQLLIGTVSNTVHVSENLTTNGWIQVK